MQPFLTMNGHCVLSSACGLAGAFLKGRQQALFSTGGGKVVVMSPKPRGTEGNSRAPCQAPLSPSHQAPARQLAKRARVFGKGCAF